MTKVLVTGAGGFVARNLRPALVHDGFEVISVSRSGMEPVEGERMLPISGYDDPGISEAARGCRAAIHLVGGGQQTIHQLYHDTNYLPAAAVASICRELGIPRLVYLSGLGVSPHATSGYFISKYMAEQAVIRSVPEPVIFRPSYILGRDDHLTANLRRQARTGAIIIPGSGDYTMQPISIRDTVHILKMSATAGNFAGRTLDMVGPHTITFAEYARAFAGAHARIVHTSMERTYQDAVLDRSPIYTLDDLSIMVGGYGGDHATLHRMTGLQFQTIPQMLQAGSGA